MLLNYKFSNFKAFCSESNFTMKANNKIQKMKENLMFKGDNISVMKSALVFGPNNTGKTSFLESLLFMKDIVINFDNVQKQSLPVMKNIINNSFKDNKPMTFEVEFFPTDSNDLYKFGFSLDNEFNFVNEYLHKKQKCIYNRNNGVLNEGVIDLKLFNSLFSDNDFLFLHKMIDISEKMIENKSDFINVQKFFNRIVTFDTFDQSYDQVYDYLSTGKINYIKRIAKGSDVGLEDILVKDDTSDIVVSNRGLEDESLRKVLSIKTVHKTLEGYLETPFIIFESMGTKKMISMAAFIQKAIDENSIMIIDEIGNSLHTKLSKMLLATFNEYSCSSTQLIATTHDLLLLDNKNLMRKDQMWLTDRSDGKVELYSLDEFKDNNANDTRGDILAKYLKGYFGALPYPSVSSDAYNLECEDGKTNS